MKNNIFDLYFNRLFSLPLWVKQVIYVKLKKDILSDDFTNVGAEILENDMFSLYVPVLTFEGNEELLNRACGLSSDLYTFLELCRKNYSIIEISLNMFLTMEETAKYFLFCMEQKYLEKPKSTQIYSMAEFVAGKIKIGEYFCLTKSLSRADITQALAKQRDIDVSGKKHVKLAEILDSMNLLKTQELKSLFTLKSEADKRYVVDYTSVPESSRIYIDSDEVKSAKIDALENENRRLKRKLEHLLEMVKNNV